MSGTKRKRSGETEAPLKSRRKDPRLVGGSNGISYNTGAKETAQPSTPQGKKDDEFIEIGSSSSSSSSSSEGSDEASSPIWRSKRARAAWQAKYKARNNESDGDSVSSPSSPLLNPRAMSNDNGSAAAVGSNRPATNVVTFPPSATSASLVQQISPALQSAIETRLGKKEDNSSSSHGKEKLILHMNALIGNKTSILSAAAVCSASLKSRVMNDIPPKKLAAKTSKPVAAAAMAKAWSSVYELLQHENNGLKTPVMRDLAVFIEILEGAQRYCLGEMEREKNSNDKGGKTVKLSMAKMSRDYGQDGGKPSDLPCASCTHGFCDKVPGFDENKKKNRQITKEFIETKKHL